MVEEHLEQGDLEEDHVQVDLDEIKEEWEKPKSINESTRTETSIHESSSFIQEALEIAYNDISKIITVQTVEPDIE